MAMTGEQQKKFETLVRRLEKYARDRPADYRLSVGLLAVLGYAYIIFVFLLLLAMIWGAKTLLVATSSANLSGQLNWIALLISLGLLRLARLRSCSAN